jgi:hypothetical protein
MYPETLGFGEVASAVSLVPHILLTGAVAVGIGLLWLRRGTRALRVILACVVSLAGVLSAYGMVRDVGYVGPLLTGQASMTCTGKAPRLCMPTATAGNIVTVRQQAVSILQDLRQARVSRNPGVITDTLQEGRYPRPSTATTMRIPLTRAAAAGTVRFQVLSASIRFSCARPDLAKGRAAFLWAARITGEEDAYRDRMALESEMDDPKSPAGLAQVSTVVDEIRTKSAEEQADWFTRTLAEACEGTT